MIVVYMDPSGVNTYYSVGFGARTVEGLGSWIEGLGLTLHMLASTVLGKQMKVQAFRVTLSPAAGIGPSKLRRNCVDQCRK